MKNLIDEFRNKGIYVNTLLAEELIKELEYLKKAKEKGCVQSCDYTNVSDAKAKILDDIISRLGIEKFK